MKNTTFEKDLFRYYGENGENLKKRLLRPTELTYIYIYRQIQSTKNGLFVNSWGKIKWNWCGSLSYRISFGFFTFVFKHM